MSKLKKGTISYSAFVMPESFKKKSISELKEGFIKMKFIEIDEETSQSSAEGFVDPIDIFDSENFNNIQQGGFYAVAIRVDEYKFSADRKEIEFRKLCNANVIDVDTIHGEQKEIMLDKVFSNLKEKDSPKTKLVHVVFDFASETIFLLDPSDRMASVFMLLFEKAFDDELSFINNSIKMEALDSSGYDFLRWIYTTARDEGQIDFNGEIITVLNETEIKMTAENSTEFSLRTNDLNSEEIVTKNLEEGLINELKLRIIYGADEYVFSLKENKLTPIKIKLPFGIISGEEDIIPQRMEHLSRVELFLRGFFAMFAKHLQEGI